MDPNETRFIKEYKITIGKKRVVYMLSETKDRQWLMGSPIVGYGDEIIDAQTASAYIKQHPERLIQFITTDERNIVRTNYYKY